MATRTVSNRWLLPLWLIPAVPAAVVIGWLCWFAWVSGYPPGPLAGLDDWWRSAAQPGRSWTLLAALALLAAGLVAYWWPRRHWQHPFGLIIVAVMVVVAAVAGTTSYLPCRGQTSVPGVAFWILQLFVGQPPNVYQNYSSGGVCSVPPLALQLGQIDGLGTTVIGTLAVASVLWRQPLDQVRSRFTRKAAIFTGLSAQTMPLLARLAEPDPAGVIVIEPREDHPLLKEARGTGARIVTGEPDSAALLRPIIKAWRGCAITGVYALRESIKENEAVITAVQAILRGYSADQNRQPTLVALIGDPRRAEYWRGAHSAESDSWFSDALSPAETTARSLAARLLGGSARQLVLCGDNMLTVALLLELARRAWEQAELEKAAAVGRAEDPAAPGPPGPLPIRRIVLLDQGAADILREYGASASPRVAVFLPDTVALSTPWPGELLRMLDKMGPERAAETAVVITQDPSDSVRHEAGRIARLHPRTPVFALASGSQAADKAIFDMLQLVEPSLLVDGKVPEDSWTRVARHWHECYRLRHPVLPGHPKESARRPWADLEEYVREDNILLLRSILTAVASLGRQWTPLHQVPVGSIVELSETELTEVTMMEHNRWRKRRLDAGRGGDLLVPWSELPAAQRAENRDLLRSQLSQLEDVGFVPALPRGGPPGAGRYRRVGTVRASRLGKPLNWMNSVGEQMRGLAGDWRVTDEKGNLRTVTDPEFHASHEPLGRNRWRRTGEYSAWRAAESLVIRTKEGRATAQAGDWIVEAPTGERWPVREAQFRWSYRPASEAQPGRTATPAGGAGR